jgi:Tol biopolymer transport system component/DNA-binding winged helix-turn-helix (wHTH) protein
MGSSTSNLYEFGPFHLDTAEHQLLRDGVPVPLRPKVFDTLVVLVENSGHLIEKEKLLEKVWPGQFVEETNLNKSISTLRHVLGENPASHQYIETVPKVGYRFVGSVRRASNSVSELTFEKHARTRIQIEEESNGDSLADGELTIAGAALEAVAASATAGAYQAEVKKPKTQQQARMPQRRARAATLATLVVLAAVTIFLLLKFAAWDKLKWSGHVVVPRPEMTLVRLTSAGKAGAPAISPDGKYVVYVLSEGGRQSLWLRQVGTDSNKEIADAASVSYEALTFSHDGSHLYFVKSDKATPVRVLYRMPILGGIPTRLIEDILDGVALSPDDSQIAFSRVYHNRNECALMLANTDGSSERKLAARKSPDVFGRPAWSPDGRVIAARTGNGDKGGLMCNVVEVRIADGAERNITRQGWPWIRDVAWLRDGTGLLMTATDQLGRNQIWLLPYPDGEARRITNDFDRYSDLSLTADSKTLATTLAGSVWNVWIVPNSDPNLSLALGVKFPVDATGARKITSGTGGLSWTPDGRVVFPSYVSGNGEIWTVKPDGTDLKQLTTGAGAKRVPVVSPDGRYLVYASDATGALHLWRMKTGDGNVAPLTEGSGGENFPAFSADGKWVVYTQVSDWTLWRVPIEGGSPIQLTTAYSKAPTVSPDGRLIAYHFREKQQDLNWKIAVAPFEGGAPVKLFDVPRGDFQSWDIRWTRDGGALTYEATNDGVSNIWRQPLAGGGPTQLTDFKSDRISYFAWSPDGQQLACIRGDWTQDIVLISNFARTRD